MALITKDKKYTTRSGSPVRVLCVDAEEITNYPVVFLLGCEILTATSDGFYRASREINRFDLIEVADIKFPQFKRGDVVKVSDHKRGWQVRVFSHSDEFYAYTYLSDKGETAGWNFCELFVISEEN